MPNFLDPKAERAEIGFQKVFLIGRKFCFILKNQIRKFSKSLAVYLALRPPPTHTSNHITKLQNIIIHSIFVYSRYLYYPLFSIKFIISSYSRGLSDLRRVGPKNIGPLTLLIPTIKFSTVVREKFSRIIIFNPQQNLKIENTSQGLAKIQTPEILDCLLVFSFHI